MNSSSTRTITFEHTIKVEASEAAFEFLDAMSFLDIDRLADVDEARIEIGTVVSDCCRRLVRGVVEKGILTARSSSSHSALPSPSKSRSS